MIIGTPRHNPFETLTRTAFGFGPHGAKPRRKQNKTAKAQQWARNKRRLLSVMKRINRKEAAKVTW